MIGDECTVGHYCPSGSSLPKPCEPGYYMNHSQSAECDPCPARYFCTNQVKPTPCSPGKCSTTIAHVMFTTCRKFDLLIDRVKIILFYFKSLKPGFCNDLK